MSAQAHQSEFDDPVFADEYERIADTFIDTAKAASTLKDIIPTGSRIFEIGLGTGYFARHFIGPSERYYICGIQPQDEMLSRLKQKHPDIAIKAEASLQEYIFDEQYDVIVSHSSVFLFTRLYHVRPSSFEECLIFQSSIRSRTETFSNLMKVLDALGPSGKFCVNIQTNARDVAVIDRDLTFEMIRCEYDLVREQVTKTFRTTSRGESQLAHDESYVLPYISFAAEMERRDCEVRVASNHEWVVLTRMQGG